MNKVFNDCISNAPSKYIDGCETICVVRENGNCKFYYVVFKPIFENNNDSEYYYAHVFEDMYDLINFFADNSKRKDYIEPNYYPNYYDAFKTKEEYCRWFDNLQYN